jgi:hypothetical protein
MEALYLKLPMEESSGGQEAISYRVAGAARGSPLVNERYHGPLFTVRGVLVKAITKFFALSLPK